MADHARVVSTDTTPSSTDRRLIAVGILGRTNGRTVKTVRTEAGTTGTVTAVKR
ncbi:hypothetical protein [Streptomyces sp900116325]|uniref:hypothetical protein n=1 Tax=Streptomyces sp. 900116325 TaxID=3154295 RepID=UPI0033BC2456